MSDINGWSARCLLGWFTALTLGLLNSSAQAESTWQLMKELLSQGKASEAYQQGAAVIEAEEGELNFDYYYGMAAIDAGEVSRGVFALERVLYLKPNFQAAQLELARGYFLLEQYDLAKQTFLRVLTATPPLSVRDKVNVFLAVIEKRELRNQPRLLAYFEGTSGYDSNTNFSPDNASFFSPILGEGTLDDSGISKAGGFNDLLAGISYYKSFDEQVTQFFRLDLADHNIWWTGDIDTLAYTAQMGFISQSRGGNCFSGQFLYQNYELAGEAYRSMVGLAASSSYSLSPQRSIQFGASLLEFDYETLDNRDAVEYNLSAGINQQSNFLYPAFWSASLQLGRDDPELSSATTAAQTERDFGRVVLSQRVPLSDRLALTATVSYQENKYAGEDILFVVTREDELMDITLQLDWRWDIHWRLRLETGYKQQNSNIDIYQYDRTHAQLGVRYEYY